MSIRTYSELIRLPTFEERYRYLELGGVVGRETFGFDRYLNQVLYRSDEWRKATRPNIIIRDNGNDLGIDGREIVGRLYVHHIHPITLEDVELRRDCLFDPENLICCAHHTHNAIHFGDASLLILMPPERRKGDTQLW